MGKAAMTDFDQQRNGHLEDFDSAKGDVEAGSRMATISPSTLIQSGLLTVLNDDTRAYDNTSAYDESVRRGVEKARRTPPNDEMERSPSAFIEAVLNGGGFSVTTGQMDGMISESNPRTEQQRNNNTNNDQFYDDTYTFDGSTITSANDITHKKYAQQHTVVDFNPQAAAAAAAAAMNPYLPQRVQQQHQQQQVPVAKETEFASVSSKTASSSWTKKTDKSQAAKICFGLGRLGLVLTLLAILAVSIAVILYLVLGNDQRPPPPSSACCRGSFEEGWSGREICNPQGGCCVVCSSSIIGSNANANPDTDNGNADPNNANPGDNATGEEPGDANGSTGAAETEMPSSNPITAPPVFQSTKSPGNHQDATRMPSQAPTVPPEKTPQPTEITPPPTVQRKTPSPTATPVRTPPPTDAPSAAPSFLKIVAATIPPAEPDHPCCSNGRQWGDFVGRVRCLYSNPPICCKVCNLD